MTAVSFEGDHRVGPGAMIDGLFAAAANPFNRRKVLMALRSSLTDIDGIAPEAVPHVAPYLPGLKRQANPVQKRRHQQRERAFYLAAGLFGLWHVNHDLARSNVPLGSALARLRHSNPVAADALIRDLSRAPQDQVANIATRAVTLLGQAGIPLDWRALAHDLTAKTNTQWRAAQREWATKYHYTSHP